MSLKQQIKQEAAAEKEKFSRMSTSDKIWYIAEYYKFHILGIVIVIALLGTIGSTVYRSIYYQSTLYGFIINNRSATPLDTAPFEQDFAEYMGYSDRQQLTLESSYISYGDDATEFSYASMAKLSALIAAKDLDFMIVDEENLQHYMEMDAFIHLEDYLPADILAAVESRLVYAPDAGGSEIACAISLDGTAFSDDLHLAPDCRYITLVSNSQRLDTALSLLRYIFVL